MRNQFTRYLIDTIKLQASTPRIMQFVIWIIGDLFKGEPHNKDTVFEGCLGDGATQKCPNTEIFLSTFFCIWTGNFIFVNFSRILFLWLYFIFYKLLIVSKYTLCTEHCVKFHQIFWCGNFVEKHGFHKISGESPFHKISTPGNKVKLRYLCIEESKSCLSYRILYFYLFRWFINLICRAICEINFCMICYTKCFKESGGTHSHSDTHSLTYSRRKHIRIISLWLDVHLRTENLMEALQYLLSNAGVLVGKRNTSNRIWYQFLQQFEPCICEVIVYETKRSRMDQVKLWKTAFKKLEQTISLQVV